MELINQHTKRIMEGCKERAKAAGLSFQDETLEYIVSNQDLVKLSPKVMIPTLYDYWVHDVEVIRGQKIYDVYPNNPYETVINTRPPISFYNDNNPDWLNVMIFYHVIAHIDFFQNNHYFADTWDYDFAAEALADKRHINNLRSKYGKQVDYIIEFARSVDNLVGFHGELSRKYSKGNERFSEKVNFFFDVFLQHYLKVKTGEYLKNVELYNRLIKDQPEFGESNFFSQIEQKYPEFYALFEKEKEKKKQKNSLDLMQYLIAHSPYMNREENRWMKTIMEIVRSTSIFFQPQIRTKIMNEGWASYWHEKLFLSDDRIKGHEVQFSITNAKVTSLPRIGLNPYAIGLRLFHYIEELADKGRLAYNFQKLKDVEERKVYNKNTDKGLEYIFKVRQEYCDHTFLNSFIDQEFVTKNKLFVTRKRLNKQKMIWEYYIKSKNYQDYLSMLNESMYHPPKIEILNEKSEGDSLYLNHIFEGKPLVKDFVGNTLINIGKLWGEVVELETNEILSVPEAKENSDDIDETQIDWERVVYKVENNKITRRKL